VVFTIENYEARMVPSATKSPQCFTRMNEVEHGHIVVSDAALSRMFQQKLSKSSKISDLKVHAKDGHIVISGTVHKGLPIPFSVEGPVDSDGRELRLHADKVKAAGIPIKGLLDMLGVELGSMLNPGPDKGVTVKQNVIWFDPAVLGHIRGHIEHLQIAGQELVVDYGKPRTTLAQAKAPKKGK
jgi:hypothetical protein